MTIPEFFTPAWCPPWTAALINHLWQSTTIVLVAWLLTLLLRTNPARVRYAIWMTASIKFLVPFTFLSSLGAHWAIPNPSPQAGPSIYAIVEDFGQPFHRANAPGPLAPIVSSPSHSIQLTSSLFAAVWLCTLAASRRDGAMCRACCKRPRTRCASPRREKRWNKEAYSSGSFASRD